MSEVNSWGVIGGGVIGSELQRQLAQPATAARLGIDTQPDFVMRSSGLYDTTGAAIAAQSLEQLPKLPDVVFVAMPTTDDGNVALQYIEESLGRGARVITAEKGALANHFETLREASDRFRRLGMTATVGGGTRLLREAAAYCTDPGDISEMHFALNGTLAAVFGAVGPETSLETAVQQAVDLGYAEPGAADPLDVIRAEAEGDIPKKTAILMNVLGLSQKALDWRDLTFNLSDTELAQAAREARSRRFVVSILPEIQSGTEPQLDVLGGFDVEHDGMRVVGGFQHIKSNPLLAQLAPGDGPNNGFVIGLGPHNSHGVYSVSGPGAGAGPTVSSMLYDYAAMKT